MSEPLVEAVVVAEPAAATSAARVDEEANATITMRVIAPSDLPEGYELTVERNSETNNGKQLVVVRVPEGGVKAGQEFDAVIVAPGAGTGTNSVVNLNGNGDGDNNFANNPHRIPTGRWRDGLFDCFTLGICHVQCCLTYWCHWCALGQVLTRLQLSWTATPLLTTVATDGYTSTSTDGQIVTKGEATASTATTTTVSRANVGLSAFAILFGLGFLDFVVQSTLSELRDSDHAVDATANAYGVEDSYGAVQYSITGLLKSENCVYDIISYVWSLAAFVFLFVVTMRLRRHVRQQYAIREEHCVGCEDCCCAYWCMPCVICQTARHTADYTRYPADCCSETGLPATATATAGGAV